MCQCVSHWTFISLQKHDRRNKSLIRLRYYSRLPVYISQPPGIQSGWERVNGWILKTIEHQWKNAFDTYKHDRWTILKSVLSRCWYTFFSKLPYLRCTHSKNSLVDVRVPGHLVRIWAIAKTIPSHVTIWRQHGTSLQYIRYIQGPSSNYLPHSTKSAPNLHDVPPSKRDLAWSTAVDDWFVAAGSRDRGSAARLTNSDNIPFPR